MTTLANWQHRILVIYLNADKLIYICQSRLPELKSVILTDLNGRVRNNLANLGALPQISGEDTVQEKGERSHILPHFKSPVIQSKKILLIEKNKTIKIL